MCRTRVLSLIAAGLAAGAAGAQGSRELARRLDIAISLRDAASRELAQYEARRSQRTYSDTVALGNGAIRVITTPDLAANVRAAVAEADPVLLRRYGPAMMKATGAMLYVRTDSLLHENKMVMVGRLDGKNEVFNRNASDAPASIASVLTMLANDVLMQGVSPALFRMIAGAVLADTVTDEQWRGIRLALATSASYVAKRCLDQNVAACRTLLEFNGTTIEAATTFFDSIGRRQIIAQSTFWSSVDLAGQKSCVHGDDRRCIEMIRGDYTLYPVRGTGHVALARVAVQMGGDGALQRLVSKGGSEVEVLSAAANAPIDSIVKRWAKNVATRGAVSDAFSLSIAAMAIGWTLLMVVLALRSSRWR